MNSTVPKSTPPKSSSKATTTKRASLRLSFLRKEQFQVNIACPVDAPTEAEYLPEDFAPSSKDIICGRGKNAFNHVGNQRFRVIISMNVNSYLAAKSRLDKTHVVNAIVDSIRESSPTKTGFVKQDPGTKRWIALGDDVAREKVGHALRDAVSQHQQASKMEPEPVVSRSSLDRRTQNMLKAQQSIFQSYLQERRCSRRSSRRDSTLQVRRSSTLQDSPVRRRSSRRSILNTFYV